MDLLLGLVVWGIGEPGLRMCARGALRIGLVLYLGAFMASSLVQLTRGAPFAKWLLRNRRQLGFSFGTAHFFHIGFVILLDGGGFLPADREIFKEGGVVIYGFIALLMATSFDVTARPLPRWLWVGLHKLGIHVVWVAFFFAYLGDVQEQGLFFLPFLLAVTGALVVRWWTAIAGWRARAAAPA